MKNSVTTKAVRVACLVKGRMTHILSMWALERWVREGEKERNTAGLLATKV
jgi:hypothetical protein